MQVIYDNSGYIYLRGSGIRKPDGIPFMEVEVPEGKFLEKIDTSQEVHQPVFSDIPKSEVDLLKERVDQLEAQNTALIEGINNML